MTTDWLLRVGDGENFINSSKYKIWGIDSKVGACKSFLKKVRTGDRLWFIKHKSKGKIIAVATFQSYNERQLGPIIEVSFNDNELGWTGGGRDWNADTEIHYSDLYWLEKCNLLTNIMGSVTIREYSEKCRVDLALEYSYITKYSKIKFEL